MSLPSGRARPPHVRVERRTKVEFISHKLAVEPPSEAQRPRTDRFPTTPFWSGFFDSDSTPKRGRAGEKQRRRRSLSASRSSTPSPSIAQTASACILARCSCIARFVHGWRPSLVAYERLERLSLLASLSITHPCFHHRLGSTEIPVLDHLVNLRLFRFILLELVIFGLLPVEASPSAAFRLHSSVPQAVAQRVAPRRRRWLSCCRRLVVLLVQHSPTTPSQQGGCSSARRQLGALLHHRRVAHLLLHPYPSGSGRRSDQQGGLHTHQCRGRSSSHREPAQHARRSASGCLSRRPLRHQLGRQQ